MRRIVGLLVLAATQLLLFPAPAAQAQEEEPGSAMVMTVELSPSARAAYRSAVEDLAKAAAEQGAQTPWYLWSHDRGFTVVLPIPNLGWLDDEDAFWGQFDEATRKGFLSALASVPREVTSEVTRQVPDWSYDPASPPDEINVAHVHHDWLNPGAEQAYDELSKEWVAFLEKIGYPYEVSCMRTRIGQQKVTCVTFADNLSRFMSDETWTDLVEAAGAGDEFQALLERWRPMVSRWSHMNAGFVKSMSYWPGKTD